MDPDWISGFGSTGRANAVADPVERISLAVLVSNWPVKSSLMLNANALAAWAGSLHVRRALSFTRIIRSVTYSPA